MKTDTPTTSSQSSTLLSDLRALPRPFWVLFSGTFINRFGTFVWPFLTIFLTQQGHSLTAAAVAVSSFGVGSSLGSAVGGWMSDHVGRRNTIVIGAALAAVFLMCLYFARSLPVVMLCTLLTGLCNGTYVPAANALLTDVVPEHLRMRGFSALRMAANAGVGSGAATAGFLAHYGYLGLFVGDAITTLSYAALAFLLLPHGLRGQTAQVPWSAAMSQLRQDRAFHAQFIATFCAALVFAQFGTTLSVYMVHSGLSLTLFGWQAPPESLYGLLLGFNCIMVSTCELPLSGFTRRQNPVRIMSLGYLLLGLGFAGNGLAWNLPVHFVMMAVFTLGEMFSTPVSATYVSTLAPESMRGRYMGALMLAWNGAGVLGPIAGSLLYQKAPKALWTVCALLGAISALVIRRSGRRRGALVETQTAAVVAG